MSTTVVIADDHPIVREGVRKLLEGEQFEIVGEASDGLAAVNLVERLRPDIVVLDLAMPVLNGTGAAREIAKISPRTRVVLLTMYTEERHILGALRAGVKACISKTQAPEHLLQAIREVCAGGIYLSPTISGIVVQGYLAKADVSDERLTNRERQVLQLVAEGNTTKQIAVALGVTVRTAESHRSALMEKLDIHSTAELVRYAIRGGLVQP
jgi:DNA-binding NarL/FixJ family response regulator